MILPNNNIDIMTVRNYTECPSVDLGTLVAKAKYGGKSGWAFNIKENGAGVWDGTKIDGAFPYWNIWSNNSPGEWRGGLPCTFALKKDANNSYCFDLGAYRGHDTDAKEPDVPDILLSGTNTMNYNKIISCNTGSYDWRKILGATHARIVEVNTSNQIVKRAALVQLTGTNMRINGTFSGTLYDSYINKLYIALCSSDGNETAYIPVEGSIEYKLIKNTTARINGSFKYSAGNTVRGMGTSVEVVFGSNSVTSHIKKTSLMASKDLALKSVDIRYFDKNNDLVYTEDRAPNDTYDSPIYQDWAEVGVGSTMPFRCHISTTGWGKITYDGCSIQATMYYE